MKKQMTYIALALTFLSGCQTIETPKDAFKGKEIVVTKSDNNFQIEFEYGSSSLSADEIKHLDTIVMNHDIVRQDRLFVQIAANGGSLAQDRAEIIAEYLKGLGLSPVLTVSQKQDELQSVKILLERYSVSVPDCPNWSRRSTKNFDNLPHANFGCADATNLALMVADPRDLVRGRDLSPADARVLSNAIDLYRNPTATVHGDAYNSVNP